MDALGALAEGLTGRTLEDSNRETLGFIEFARTMQLREAGDLRAVGTADLAVELLPVGSQDRLAAAEDRVLVLSRAGLPQDAERAFKEYNSCVRQAKDLNSLGSERRLFELARQRNMLASPLMPSDPAARLKQAAVTLLSIWHQALPQMGDSDTAVIRLYRSLMLRRAIELSLIVLPRALERGLQRVAYDASRTLPYELLSVIENGPSSHVWRLQHSETLLRAATISRDDVLLTRVQSAQSWLRTTRVDTTTVMPSSNYVGP